MATFAVVGGKSLWYLTRGSGVVSLLLLSASVVLGLLSSGRLESVRWPRFVIEGMHRNVSLVVLVFLAIHVATTILDGFVPIGWLDVVLPFHAGYRPVWIGLGALAVDCLLAIVITSLLRVRIGPRVWRGVHWLAYLCWPIALVHGLGAGSDAPARWMLVVDAVSLVAVFVCLCWRILVRRPAHPVAAPLALVASFALPIFIALFAWRGPLAPAWSTHGGRLGASSATTPAGQSTGADTAGTTPPATTAPAASLPIDASITGTRTVSENGSQRTVSLVGHGADGVLTVRIDLTGRADTSGGVVLQNGTVRATSTTSGTTWNGAVAALHGATITGDLSSSSGQQVAFTVEVVVNRAAGTFTGTVHMAAGPTLHGDD